MPDPLQPVPATQPRIVDVQADPKASMAASVVWGGVIASIANESSGTRIEVVARALDRNQRPVSSDRSEGRFRMFFPGLLDPQVYAPQREITVRGFVTGLTAGSIGEYAYSFPEIRAASVHLWPVPVPEPTVIYRDPFWDPWDPFHRYPWHPRFRGYY